MSGAILPMTPAGTSLISLESAGVCKVRKNDRIYTAVYWSNIGTLLLSSDLV
jgi:hypothetical protein